MYLASVGARRNRDGSVTWRVQFRINGRMSQESFEQQDAAEKFGQLVDRLGGEAARAIREKRNASVAPSLAEFTTSFLDPSQGHLSGVTPGTRYGYRQIADNSFIKFLGQLPIDAITNQDVARWIAWQEKVPSTRFVGQLVAAKTIRNCHGLLSTILNAAVAAKLIEHNPAKGTSLLRGRRQGVSFLTQDEFDTLLHFIPERDRPLVLMLAGTGMRWGEATAITWGDIDPTSNPALLTIDKAWKKAERSGVVLGPPKTHRGNRTISLWPELVEALGPRGNSADLVFRGARNVSRVRSPRFHEHSWTPAVDAANDAVRCGRRDSHRSVNDHVSMTCATRMLRG